MKIKNKIILLNGITSSPCKTIGIVNIMINEVICQFHVLKDEDCNFYFDGILGREFCRKTDTDVLLSKNCIRIGKDYISFNDNEIIIPARTKQLLNINVKNFKSKKGYIDDIPICEGVFIGHALAKK